MLFTAKLTFDAPSASKAEAVTEAFKNLLNEYGVTASVSEPEPAAEAPVLVWTDGGCDSKRDGIGAWAYLIHWPDGSVQEASDALLGTTNNRMELMAVLRVLQALEIGPKTKIVSDSEYVIKGATVWSKNWVKYGWKTYDGAHVKNRDLWEQLVALVSLHDVDFEHVKGHSGHPQNERVDSLCTAKMNQCYGLAIKGEFSAIDEGAANR
jgi:ribonuclease HI